MGHHLVPSFSIFFLVKSPHFLVNFPQLKANGGCSIALLPVLAASHEHFGDTAGHACDVSAAGGWDLMGRSYRPEMTIYWGIPGLVMTNTTMENHHL